MKHLATALIAVALLASCGPLNLKKAQSSPDHAFVAPEDYIDRIRGVTVDADKSNTFGTVYFFKNADKFALRYFGASYVGNYAVKGKTICFEKTASLILDDGCYLIYRSLKYKASFFAFGPSGDYEVIFQRERDGFDKFIQQSGNGEAVAQQVRSIEGSDFSYSK